MWISDPNYCKLGGDIPQGMIKVLQKYRKILKISPGAYIFQRPFLRDLFLEGPKYGGKSARLILGGKFTSQNRLG